LKKIYYNRKPQEDIYLSRVEELNSKRLEAIQFILVVVGLSFGINLLSSFTYKFIPYPGIITGILILGISIYIYSKLWSGLNGEYNSPVLLLLDKKENNNLERIVALVQGVGFGLSIDASKELFKLIGNKMEKPIEYHTLPVVESLVFGTISGAFSDGWYFPGKYYENLNIKWVQSEESKTNSKKINFDSIIPDDHPFKHLDNSKEFMVPEGTEINFEKNKTDKESKIILKNSFVTIKIKINWNFSGPAESSIDSPWVPKNKKISVYVIQIETNYSLKSKLYFSKKSYENMVWAERLSEYLSTHTSFRMFEESQNKKWREKEINAVERILGISRWQ